ncbi:MAG: PAS domain S-box protein [Magnetococcus sp. XQGC-1]
MIDIAKLQSLAEAIHRAAGIPFAIVDPNNNILVATGRQEICTRFHRVHPDTCRHCQESDAYFAHHLREERPPARCIEFRCANGLWEIAIPITVDGKLLATCLLGQFLYEGEQPDRDHFRNQARQCGFAESAYLAALDRVPLLSRERVQAIIAYDLELLSLLSSLGLTALQQREELLRCQTAEAALKKRIVQLEQVNTPPRNETEAQRTAESEQPLEQQSAVVKEITARKMTQETLDRQEIFLATVLENVQDGIVACDGQGILTLFNKATRMFHGIDAKNLPANQWADHYDLYLADGVTPMSMEDIPLFRAFRGETVYNQEMVIAPKGGARRILLASGRAMHDAQGEKIGAVVSLHNITEQRAIQDALRASEERFRSLFESAPDAIFLADPATGVLLDANAAACRLLGKPLEQLKGLHQTELHPPASDAYAREVFQEQTGKPGGFIGKPFEINVLRSDGQLIPVEITASMHRFCGNHLLQGVFRDITERKRAEKALRHEQELSFDLIRSHPAGLYRVRIFPSHQWQEGAWESSAQAPYAVEMLNDRFLEILGVTKEEYTANPGILNDLIHPEDRASFTRAHEDAMTRPTMFNWDGRIETNGQTRWVYFESLPRMQENGDVVWTGFVQDITERRRAEEELQAKELFLRMIYEKTQAAIFVVDITANGDFRYVSWNHTGEVITGITSEQAKGRTPEDIFGPIEGERIRANYVICVKEGSHAYEESFHSGTGTRWSQTTLTLIEDNNGRPQQILGVTANITKLKQAEMEREKLQTQLAQAQKMESVGRLAGGIAHDFNNMLGIILFHTELVQDEIGTNEPLSTSMEQIKEAARRSVSLTRQLLTFSRQQVVTPEVIDLNMRVEGMFKMLKRLIGEHIDMVWLPGSNLGSVKIDPSQIDQLLANLCVNARDAITGTGRVTIETNHVTFSAEESAQHADFTPGDFVQLTVSDNGCGMNAETLARIFEPFFTTKEVGRGTGLGLATVYGIVRQNGGFIRVHSEPGRGTIFKIHLPRQSALATHQAEPTPTLAQGGNTLLLVEDEPGVLQTLTMILQRMGYKVLGAGTPGEAIRLAQLHSVDIDLLITDVVMPEMNGHELSARLLSICPKLKRLFMSGYTADLINQQGGVDPHIQFIQKPFTISDLEAKIRNAIGNA